MEKIPLKSESLNKLMENKLINLLQSAEQLWRKQILGNT